VPVSESEFNPQYVIHSDEEPLRLERQARMYGTADDLRFLAPGPSDHVLDAGCGSGSMTRAIARALPKGKVFGLDREARYIDFARRKAEAEQIANARFEVGDVLSLPFPDGTFDLLWSKHLLQWVGQRRQALAEFKRVTRSGGRIVCCNFDRFCLAHYPTDNQLQTDLEMWFAAAEREFGFDTDLGRKLPHMFKTAGLVDVRADFIPDRVFCGFGGDPERRWNWEAQFNSAMPFTTKVFGSEDRARDFSRRVVERFSDPEVYVYCTLFYVEGRVP
jgi:ubiquinone/menaquinone biosynthesis C-methylase UbiE